MCAIPDLLCVYVVQTKDFFTIKLVIKIMEAY